jgi:uncharacterized membrane protein
VSQTGAPATTVIRRLIGWAIALLGIAFALGVGGFGAILTGGYWDAPETGGWEGRSVLILSVLMSLAVGYLIYRLGRRIAR